MLILSGNRIEPLRRSFPDGNLQFRKARLTSSGTNPLRGNAFEFLRNSALDARNDFDQGSILEFQRNQDGEASSSTLQLFLQGSVKTFTVVPSPTELDWRMLAGSAFLQDTVKVGKRVELRADRRSMPQPFIGEMRLISLFKSIIRRRWRSGNAQACKTCTRGFDSRPALQSFNDSSHRGVESPSW